MISLSICSVSASVKWIIRLRTDGEGFSPFHHSMRCERKQMKIILSLQNDTRDDENRKRSYNAIKGIIFHCCCNHLWVSDIGCDSFVDKKKRWKAMERASYENALVVLLRNFLSSTGKLSKGVKKILFRIFLNFYWFSRETRFP